MGDPAEEGRGRECQLRRLRRACVRVCVDQKEEENQSIETETFVCVCVEGGGGGGVEKVCACSQFLGNFLSDH